MKKTTHDTRKENVFRSETFRTVHIREDTRKYRFDISSAMFGISRNRARLLRHRRGKYAPEPLRSRTCSDRVTRCRIRTATGSAHKLSNRVTRVYTVVAEKKEQSRESSRESRFRGADTIRKHLECRGIEAEEFDTHVSLSGQRTLFSSLQ